MGGHLSSGLSFYYEDEESLIGDVYLFNEGKNFRLYELMGAHFLGDKDKKCVRFLVWAPKASYVNLTGDFNSWNDFDLPLKRIGTTGVWQIVVRGVQEADRYKYRIVAGDGKISYKADPFGFFFEKRPKTASRVKDISSYKWSDFSWLEKRKADKLSCPISIYELNLSSWLKGKEGEELSYVSLAKKVSSYVKKMGYSHVELMPITEYPYDGSWGYQATGYFAPTSRFGKPEDFMAFVDILHKNSIGVILDWVPGHFCKDQHGLSYFDGGPTFESHNPDFAENLQWGTGNFDYGKNEVRSFLIASALFWHDYYHIDGLRVDAVAYMIYIDFTKPGLLFKDGTNINKDAVSFLKLLNEKVYEFFPDSIMIAEESTAFPKITGRTDLGGLGFLFKWNMGWMNDMIKYMNMDPYFRKDNHNLLTFSLIYAFNENFILAFSHDEVVHAKGSMLNKMFGSYEDRFRQLGLLYCYMFCHPGKKLLFMGMDFGQFDEWNEWGELSWNLLAYPSHKFINDLVRDLNRLYRSESPLHRMDSRPDTFKWIDCNNNRESVISFERFDDFGNKLVCVFNFTGIFRKNYPIGVSDSGKYSVLINSAHKRYGGEILRNKSYKAKKESLNGRDYTLTIDLAGFSAMILKKKQEG